MSASNLPANTWLGIAEKVKEFFQEKVANDFYLQVQDSEEEPIYREPYVDLQTLPHKNFTPPEWMEMSHERAYQAPYILIQTNNLRLQGNTVTLNVRAVFGVYASGTYDATDGLNVPDNKAYMDLMIAMQKAIEAITTHQVFGNAVLAAGYDITADVYDLDTPTWPYAYGNVSFDVQYTFPIKTTELDL